MPILNVEIVGEADAAGEDSLAQRIADAAGGIFGSPPRGTWVRVRILPARRYAENEGAEPGVHPVFVHVVKRSVPPEEELRAEVAALTEAIAAACERPAENVHVCYEVAAAGRQAFGGTLVDE